MTYTSQCLYAAWVAMRLKAKKNYNTSETFSGVYNKSRKLNHNRMNNNETHTGQSFIYLLFYILLLFFFLDKFRKAQHKVFEESNEFMRKLIKIINIMTTAQNGGVSKIRDNLIIWDDVACLWNVSVSIKEKHRYKNNNRE